MLGILTFELMAGHPPFTCSSEVRIYKRINKGISAVKFPAAMSGVCRSYVKSMCQPEPADRLPRKKGGIENIHQHDWYAEFDWDAMKHRKNMPPYVPEVKDQYDLANFVKVNESSIPAQIPYEDDGTGWDDAFATGAMSWQRDWSRPSLSLLDV